MVATYTTQEPMSHFATTILQNKQYTHSKSGGNYETWPEAAERVVRSVMEPYLPDLVERTLRLVVERKFVPGGRYLYAAGRKNPMCNNCLAGEEEIITSQGVFSLRELVGKSFRVLNRFGQWEDATARAFGVQRLYRIKFKNGDEVYSTANHRWWQADGSRITTAELSKVPLNRFNTFPALDEEGIRHGIVYGDGTTQRGSRTDRLLLCTSNKNELKRYFSGGSVKQLSAGTTVTQLSKKYKILPNLKSCTPEYARGFIAGLIATDGNYASSVTISNKSKEAILHIRKLAVLGGCVTSQVFRGTASRNHINKTGVGPWVVRIKPFSAPIIRADQIASRDSSSYLRPTKMWLDVESVEATDRVETVYCCVVSGSESFTLANGLTTSNCFLFKCEEDTTQEWGRVADKSINALMCGGGVGVVYSALREENADIGGLGGKSTGPCALMRMVNENGRYIRQGGSRRSAIWAGLHWWHKDIFKFIALKDWPDSIRRCREEDFNFPAPMDGTNISVILDDEFFAAYHDATHRMHDHACNVYWTTIRSMLRSGEPGFSIDIGENAGENLRNACLTGDTLVATADGKGACRIDELVGKSVQVYASDSEGHIKIGTMKNVRLTRKNASVVRVTLDDGSSARMTPDHLVMLFNGSFVEAGTLTPGTRLMPFTSRVQQGYRRVGCRRRGVKQCHLVMGRTGSERDGMDVHHVNENKLDDRPQNLQILPHGKHASINMVGDRNPARRLGYDEEWRLRQSIKSTGRSNGRYVDGSRTHVREMSERHDEIKSSRRTWKKVCEWCETEFDARSPNSMTCSKTCAGRLGNKDRFYFRGGRTVVSVEPCGNEDVYDATVDGLHCFAIVTAGDDLDVRGSNFAGMVVHNCTEVTSATNGDMCNLGSANMGRLSSMDELREVVECGTAFLLCGTLYSKLPLQEMYRVREQNRRIGLGLMGVHEWLLRRGMRYGPNDELAQWMQVYQMSGAFANRLADRLSISRPIATRSIAPTGTISIIAETTSGIEPIYAVAYKRRYLEGIQWKAQYVVDAAAQRLIKSGVDPDLIEDAYTLAEDVERRVAFQCWLQRHVDHGISSTINLPPWGSTTNNESTVTQFGRKLLEHLPGLRGITAYPDGARGGQPLNRVPYSEAVKHVGVSFIEEAESTEHGNEGSCKNGVCGE